LKASAGISSRAAEEQRLAARLGRQSSVVGLNILADIDGHVEHVALGLSPESYSNILAYAIDNLADIVREKSPQSNRGADRCRASETGGLAGPSQSPTCDRFRSASATGAEKAANSSYSVER